MEVELPANGVPIDEDMMPPNDDGASDEAMGILDGEDSWHDSLEEDTIESRVLTDAQFAELLDKLRQNDTNLGPAVDLNLLSLTSQQHRAVGTAIRRNTRIRWAHAITHLLGRAQGAQLAPSPIYASPCMLLFPRK